MFCIFLNLNFQEETPEDYDKDFRCLQYALFACCFFQLAGSFAFLAMSWYVLEDKSKADAIIAENHGVSADDIDDSAPIVSHIHGQDVEQHQENNQT